LVWTPALQLQQNTASRAKNFLMSLSYQGHYDASLTAESSEQHQPDKKTQLAAKYFLPFVMNLPHSYHCTKELSGYSQQQP